MEKDKEKDLEKILKDIEKMEKECDDTKKSLSKLKDDIKELFSQPGGPGQPRP